MIIFLFFFVLSAPFVKATSLENNDTLHAPFQTCTITDLPNEIQLCVFSHLTHKTKTPFYFCRLACVSKQFFQLVQALPISINLFRLQKALFRKKRKSAANNKLLKSIGICLNIVDLNIQLCRKIDAVGFQSLIRYSNLTSLNAGQTKIKDQDLFLLPTTLQKLNLKECLISDEGIQNLALCSKLKKLNVSSCPLKKPHFLNFSKLELLNVENCELSPQGLLQLTKLSELRALKINCNLNVPSLEYIPMCTNLSKLSLNFWDLFRPLDLGKLTTLTKLQDLSLDGDTHRLIGISELKTLSIFRMGGDVSPSQLGLTQCPHLRVLDLGTYFTSDENQLYVEEIKKILPKCEIKVKWEKWLQPTSQASSEDSFEVK